MFYRVQQFIKAITATVSVQEIEWIKTYLTLPESQLFFKLKVYEQRHCIDVARILEEQTESSREMIRLGLLHDIGKIRYPLNPIEKSLIVLLDKFTRGKVAKYDRFKMVKCYYQHGELGYRLLKEIGSYEETFLTVIRKHHQVEVADQKIKLLQYADNLC